MIDVRIDLHLPYLFTFHLVRTFYFLLTFGITSINALAICRMVALAVWLFSCLTRLQNVGYL